MKRKRKHSAFCLLILLTILFSCDYSNDTTIEVIDSSHELYTEIIEWYHHFDNEPLPPSRRQEDMNDTLLQTLENIELPSSFFLAKEKGENMYAYIPCQNENPITIKVDKTGGSLAIKWKYDWCWPTSLPKLHYIQSIKEEDDTLNIFFENYSEETKFIDTLMLVEANSHWDILLRGYKGKILDLKKYLPIDSLESHNILMKRSCDEKYCE